MRHLYRIQLKDGSLAAGGNIEGKKALVAFLGCLNLERVEKVLWYVSNGQWSDVTKKYIK